MGGPFLKMSFFGSKTPSISLTKSSALTAGFSAQPKRSLFVSGQGLSSRQHSSKYMWSVVCRYTSNNYRRARVAREIHVILT